MNLKIVRDLINLNDSISPSVYIIYSSIHATASCVALLNSYIPVESIYAKVTRAYEPYVLSIAICAAKNINSDIEYCIASVEDIKNQKYCFRGIDNG